ncbi:2-hydroxymuconate tautomerase [Scopulibacillus cellulosilyticus]|uniref:Tautomerase n=1 Tax=Scopulibacillus cellulosilyticus TaxID=2665665 RepID=A0ABW2PUY3_9BACL
MPIAHIHILQGRSQEQKKQLICEVTSAISRSLDAKPESIRVLLHETAREHWATGGVTKAEEGSAGNER